MIQVVHPDPFPGFIPIPDPGSGSATLVAKLAARLLVAASSLGSQRTRIGEKIKGVVNTH
jgi:hypothetical protein